MDYTFLPKLADTGPAPAGGDGSWFSFPGGREHLLAFANALVVPTNDLSAERLKSTPSPWARPLLFEQALFAKKHPAHLQIVGEWRGLLATIGLSGYLGIEIDVVHAQVARDPTFDGFRAMLPTAGRELWDEILLIRASANGRTATLGGTSPRTVVFTGIRGIARGIVPFENNGRLIDPTVHYRDIQDAKTLTVLSKWIGLSLRETETAQERLGPVLGRASDVGGAGADSRIGHLLTLLREWQSETDDALQHLGGALVLEGQSFDDSLLAPHLGDAHPLRALHAAFRTAGRLYERETNVLYIRGTTVAADPRGATILRQGVPLSGLLRLPGGQSRQVVDGRVAEAVSVDPISQASTVDFSRWFEPKLVQLVASHAGNTATLRVRGRDGTDEYLYPFAKEVLGVVDADQLREWTTITGDASGYRVAIDLPIGDGLTVRYSQQYRPDAVVDDCNPPSLAVWPDFEAEGWSEYHYATLQLARRGARLQFDPVSDEVGHLRADAPDQGLRWGKLSKPPRAWVASEMTTPTVRGLLLGAPAEHRPSLGNHSPEWDISIDFGSTQSRVFRKTRGEDENPAEVTLRPRVRLLVGSEEHLPYFFFSGVGESESSLETERGVPSLLWLPLGTAAVNRNGWLPSDGHVFWGVKLDDDRQGKVAGNLKWRRDDAGENAAFHSFVSQLFLSVSAEAAANGAKIGSLITAYPSVLPHWLLTQHQEEWRRIAERFDVEFRGAASESEAVVEYLVKRRKGLKSQNILVVDVGGSTADFGVWRKDDVYVDSIHLAGSIFNRLLAKNPAAREAAATAAQQLLGGERIHWTADEARNEILAGLMLRRVARSGPQAMRSFASYLYSKGPGSPGELILAHVAYLYASIAFSLGMMAARVIGPEEDLFGVFFAGRGAHLLHWLEAFGPGSSKDLITHFFRAGLGMDGRDVADIEVRVEMPERDAKEEVAHGLLLVDRSKGGEGLKRPRLRTTFVGETCYANGEATLSWADPLDVETLRKMPEPPRPVELSEMAALQAFVGAFENDELARAIAEALGITRDRLDRQLRGAIHDRIFSGAWKAARSGGAAAHHLVLEPFFVLEAKALLDHLSEVPLFQ